ncbi:MAG TPA: GH3 auxin-responsive promoter family protein [Ktedonobacteraceae bacterium]|nr:GH3 auxin-responsive promoter family protein [Ktedonobacteraceae bacterium]
MQRFRVGAANLLWFLYSAGMTHKWKQATLDVADTQSAVFKRILSSNVDTEFGREHHFAEVVSIEAYQCLVPLRTYEEFQPYIDRIAEGHPGVLTLQTVRQFALTSGSTQASKLVPYTNALVSEFQEGIDPWVYYLFRSFPRMLLGKTYWSVTPVGDRKSYTAGGIAIGFDDEQQYFSPFTRWVLNSITTAPPQLAQLSDMEVFRYVTLRLLLQEKLLSWVSVWNPSFLTLLLDPLSTWFSQLTEDIKQGDLSVASKIDLPLRNVLLPLCKKNPARAKELALLYADWQGKPFIEPNVLDRTLYEAIWPHMQFISCWAHGNAALALPRLKTYFPHARIQPKGLLATEAFISFPFKEDVSALSLLSHFFEFEEVDETAPAIKLAHELQAGRRYSVIVTTGGGLYRYRLNDLIEVVDFYHQCPLIRFVGKQSKVVDICGEKLNEEYVRTTVTALLTKHNLNPSFWMIAPEWSDADRPFYTLFIQFAPDAAIDKRLLQDVAREIDEAMQESYHYGYSRRLGQLDHCRLFVIAPDSDTFHTYLTVCTDLGQRLGDVKPTALHAYQGWSRGFTGMFV